MIKKGAPHLLVANMRQNLKKISLFYFIACAISWPFFWIRDRQPELWASWDQFPRLRNIPVMWGPAIAALICFFCFQENSSQNNYISNAIRSSFWNFILFNAVHLYCRNEFQLRLSQIRTYWIHHDSRRRIRMVWISPRYTS